MQAGDVGILLDPYEALQRRRRAPRTAAEVQGVLFDGGGDEGREVAVLNVSLLGVGFRCLEKIERGTRHRIVFDTGRLRIDSAIIITRAEKRGGHYEMGAEYLDD